MQYINPFKTLGIQGRTIEELPKMLRKAKKRWLAEFKLSGSTTIQINGQELDRNGLLKLIEQAQYNATFHFTILQTPALYHFLKEGDLRFFKEKTPSLEQADPLFWKFVAPYFSSQFDIVLAEALKIGAIERIRVLTTYELPIPEDYHYECYKLASRYWKEELNLLNRNRKKVRLYFLPDRFRSFYQDYMITMLNQMPDNFFYFIRANYAENLTELSLNLSNVHGKHRMARFVVRQALKLKLNKGDQYNIQYVLDQYNGLPESKWGLGEQNLMFKVLYKIKAYYKYHFSLALFTTIITSIVASLFITIIAEVLAQHFVLRIVFWGGVILLGIYAIHIYLLKKTKDK